MKYLRASARRHVSLLQPFFFHPFPLLVFILSFPKIAVEDALDSNPDSQTGCPPSRRVIVAFIRVFVVFLSTTRRSSGQYFKISGTWCYSWLRLYRLEGRRFDSRWCHWNSSLTSSVRTMALGSTQPLPEMSTRSVSEG